MSWYAKIVAEQADGQVITDACSYFDTEYLNASRAIDMTTLRGQRIDDLAKRLPGMVGYRYRQLQELEAIMGFLDLRETAVRGQRRKYFLEHYNRALNATTVEKYVEADDQVLALALLRNQVALTRNKYLGLIKEHEHLLYQLNNLTQLLKAGVHDTLL